MEPTKFEKGVELPEPIGNNAPQESIAAQPEAGPSFGMPQPSGVSQPQPIHTSVQQPVYQQPTTAPQQLQISDQTAAALIADDADLIEKEWVLKAKAIVAQTAHDPNLQTKEVGKMKAEYLKKRYNKQLKVEES